MGKGSNSQPAPSQQVVNNTSIPSYAQPYVENMLGQTAALTDINQNPYQNYDAQRIAGFTPMQTQAMTNIGNMQIAPQLGQASGFANQSGQGSLQTAGQMAGVGQAYQNMATDPAEMQKYMNPYIQQALNPQLQLLNQQQALQGQGIAAKASGQGAFGGNRATLAQGLNAQNYALAGQQAIGQGYSDAFKQAQQAQQFGANLGLQGLQGSLAGYGQANQAAATLGQLGQTQYGQQMGINQAQQQAGAMQQALQQQGLDVNYQDFLKQKNYPYQQLAFQSDMLRGLPMSQSAQTMYSAPPSGYSQAAGLGATGLGLYGMGGGFRAKGGMVGEGYAEGGQISYKTGGDISMMTTEQLTQLLDSPSLTPMESAMIEEQLMLRSRMENNPQASKIMGGGLDTVPSGDMFQAAGGGIVAFAGPTGSVVKSKKPEDVMDYRQLIKDRLAAQETANPFIKSDEAAAAIRQDMEERKTQSPWQALAMAGLGTLAGTSQYAGTNLGLGGLEGMKDYMRSNAENAADRKLLLSQGVEAEKAKYARDTGNLNSLIAAQGQMDTREIGLKNVGATGAATAATRANTEYNKNWNNFQLRVGAEKNNLMNQKSKTFDYEQNPDKLDVDAYKNIYNKTPPDVRDSLKLPDPKTYAATASESTAPAPAVAPVVGSPANKVPPSAAIDMLKLKNSPETRAQFDAIFGPGAAKKALGK
jgi:hypothetical protein